TSPILLLPFLLFSSLFTLLLVFLISDTHKHHSHLPFTFLCPVIPTLPSLSLCTCRDVFLEMPEKGEVLTSVDNSFEKEKEETTELVPAAKEKNTLCPKEEDTVYVPGKPGLQTDKYVLGRALKTFTEAQVSGSWGNLVSIHSYYCNYKLQHLIAGINQGQVWIGSFWKKFRWTDGSSWNFSYWAIGQPFFGWGRCVALGKNGKSGNMEGGRVTSRESYYDIFVLSEFPENHNFDSKIIGWDEELPSK
uniref:C-type lectin domain-containing protein n=1 Tax=Monodelphis domestica TaxID=13616 RepID=A0A5F8H6T5_MONDO